MASPPSLNHYSRREVAVGILVLGLLIPLSWRWLYFKGETPVNGNVLREVYPNWCFSHALLSKGHWPLWNPYRDMGEPHLADPKTMAAYPLSWILASVNHFCSFLQAWFFFHTLLAALFAAAISWRWHRHGPAAGVTALMAGFNGFFMA